MPNGISATIITLNEEKNILRCLHALKDWVDEIIVVDSGSQDATLALAASCGEKVRIFKENWQGYGNQKNLAMRHCRFDWVLNVDADEVVTEELKNEVLTALASPGDTKGYRIARKTFYQGQWIQFGGWYPNYLLRLCARQGANWTNPPVHEELTVGGRIQDLKSPLLHYTFEGVDDQVRANIRYAKEGARKILENQRVQTQSDSGENCKTLMKLIFKPPIKFFESYFFKQGFRDGLLGFIIAVNAAHSMFLKFAFVLEETRKPKNMDLP